ncbi:MAG: DUF2089 domain-containing protein [Clostridiaceae bacterium]|nr:DUF2089 domain-containing protein [Clostridiaceae bacterium]
MKREVMGQCPICSGSVEITEVSCNSCKSTIKGHFKPCKFCTLSQEHKEFAEIFIKNRGSIKEIERELSVSYPTVKGKLDSLIAALGYKSQNTNPDGKKEVLEKLYRGEITSEEAIKLMNE